MFIELNSVDENGSGLTFPIALRAEDIIAIVDVSRYEERVTGSQCLLVMRNIEKPVFVTESFSVIGKALV